MTVTLRSTDRFVRINGVPGRIWEGETASGLPVTCVIAQVATPTTDPQQLAEFERDLSACAPPQPELSQAFPTRFVL